VGRRDVALVRNLAYGGAGEQNLVDVYHHRRRPGVRVLPRRLPYGLQEPGGPRAAQHLAGQGWVYVSVNYRLAPRWQYPDHHIDAKKVIAWMRVSSAGSRTVVASRTSTGGHPGRDARGDAERSGISTRFQGRRHIVRRRRAVLGALRPGRRVGIVPLDRLGEAPPFFFVHETSDSSPLIEGTREFVARLREASSRPVRFAELPGGQHAFDLVFSLRHSYVIEAVAAYCALGRSTVAPMSPPR
jgi:hypothetical protein